MQCDNNSTGHCRLWIGKGATSQEAGSGKKTNSPEFPEGTSPVNTLILAQWDHFWTPEL